MACLFVSTVAVFNSIAVFFTSYSCNDHHYRVSDESSFCYTTIQCSHLKQCCEIVYVLLLQMWLMYGMFLPYRKQKFKNGECLFHSMGSAYSNSCNPVFWAVIQVPTGPASKHTMYCTLSVSSVYYKVCGLRYTRLRIKLMVIYHGCTQSTTPPTRCYINYSYLLIVQVLTPSMQTNDT